MSRAREARRHARRSEPQEPSFDRLMNAARDLFAEQGFAATSLDDVAAAAGVTKGSLYHHFSGKTDLFEVVFEEQAELLSQRVAEVVAGKRGSTWTAAYAGIAAFLEYSQDPRVQRIMLLDAPSVLGWERVREIESRYGLALIKAVLTRLAAENLIRRHDTDTVAHLLFGALVEGSLLVARTDDPDAARRRVEREARRLLAGFAA